LFIQIYVVAWLNDLLLIDAPSSLHFYSTHRQPFISGDLLWILKTSRMKFVIYVIVLIAAKSTLQDHCVSKDFDGKEIAALPGSSSYDECKLACESTTPCKGFEVIIGANATDSGCILLKQGTNGTSITGYQFIDCCSTVGDVLINPTINTFTPQPINIISGYLTKEQCRAECEQTVGCKMFSYKRFAEIKGHGCFLLHEGTKPTQYATSSDYTHHMKALILCTGK